MFVDQHCCSEPLWISPLPSRLASTSRCFGYQPGPVTRVHRDDSPVDWLARQPKTPPRPSPGGYLIVPSERPWARAKITVVSREHTRANNMGAWQLVSCLKILKHPELARNHAREQKLISCWTKPNAFPCFSRSALTWNTKGPAIEMLPDVIRGFEVLATQPWTLGWSYLGPTLR